MLKIGGGGGGVGGAGFKRTPSGPATALPGHYEDFLMIFFVFWYPLFFSL